MTVAVSFIKTKPSRYHAEQIIGSARIREDVTIPGSTTATLEEGEYVLIGNDEDSMVMVAFGTTPDADTTAETSASSAGVPVASGSVMALGPEVGDKVNIKALS